MRPFGNTWLLARKVLILFREPILSAKHQPPRAHRARRDWDTLPYRWHRDRGFFTLARLGFCGRRIVRHLRSHARLVSRPRLRHQDKDLKLPAVFSDRIAEFTKSNSENSVHSV